MIREENSKNENTFTVSINMFADWTPEEFKKVLSYHKVEGDPYPSLVNDSIPASIDWRTEGAVNPIQDQGNCGSCWAFSAVGAMESGWYIKKGALYQLSV